MLGFLKYDLRITTDAELCDFREPFKEPALDNRIAEALAVAFGNQAHLVEVLKIPFDILCAAVCHDVIFHVFIGQTVVGLLVAVALDMALHDGVFGIVTANLLEVSVFDAVGIGGEMCKRAIHNDELLGGVDLQRILHSDVPLSFSCLIRRPAGSCGFHGTFRSRGTASGTTS